MDSVNKTLLLSLKQEVKTINDVVKDLPTSNYGEEIRSWLFPTKPYHFVTDLICRNEIVESENFRTFLELIIDRLYVGLQLILKYVEEKNWVKINKSRFLHRPRLITLGFTLRRLWQIVSQTLEENMCASQNNTNTNGRDNCHGKLFNKEIQTDITSLNKCDSCSSAMLCMKNLLQSFDANEFQIPLTKRVILKPKMYDITQFGCMMQITSSIQKAVNTLYGRLFSKEQERQSCQDEIEKLKTDISEKCIKIAFLEREVEMWKEKSENDNLKITLLSNEHEELKQIRERQDNTIKTLNDVINNLNISIKKYNEQVYQAACQKENYNVLYHRIMNNQSYVIQFSTSIQNNLSALEEQHFFITNQLKKVSGIAKNVCDKINTVSDCLAATDMKIREIGSGGCHNMSLLESKVHEFKKVLYNHNHKAELTLLNESKRMEVPYSFQIKGNPVEDLTRQMQENTETINKLENENNKLRSVINKLNCFKR